MDFYGRGGWVGKKRAVNFVVLGGWEHVNLWSLKSTRQLISKVPATENEGFNKGFCKTNRFLVSFFESRDGNKNDTARCFLLGLFFEFEESSTDTCCL